MLGVSVLRLQLRRYMKYYLFAAIIAVGLLSNSATSYASEQYTVMNDNEIGAWLKDEESVKVILHREYVCGEEIIELGSLNKENIMLQQHQNPTWKMTMDSEHTIIRFHENIDDLSPYCKKHAFFGVDKREVFSLFDGEPTNEKIMKTFFQMDIPYLESILPQTEFKKLLGGIRVTDIDEYNSVLSTFSRYSVTSDNEVMTPY